MNKELFFKKFNNHIDENEIERKWRVHLQEHEMIRLYHEQIFFSLMGGRKRKPKDKNGYIDDGYVDDGYFQ